MEQIVTNSLCGLPLAKASLAIGLLHSAIYIWLFVTLFYSTIVDYLVLMHYPNLFIFLSNALIVDITCMELLICCLTSISLTMGALRDSPGLLLIWMVQQVAIITASIFTLQLFLFLSYLKLPVAELFMELFINSAQVYFFMVVYSHFQRLRKGNLIASEASNTDP